MIHSYHMRFPWWLRHGAMDPFERTPLGRMLTDRHRNWHFHKIRLRKVQQSAFSVCFTLSSRNVKQRAAMTGFSFFDQTWQLRQHRFFQFRSRDGQHMKEQARGMSPYLQVWSLWFLLMLKIVHQIHEELKAVSALGQIDYGLLWEHKLDFSNFRTESLARF